MKRVLGVGLVGALIVLLVWAFAPAKKGVVATADSAEVPPLKPAETAPAATAQPPPGAAMQQAGTAAQGSGASAGAEATACARLGSLCSTTDQKVDTGECEKKLADARRVSGDGNVERSESCISEAKTCAAATGCLSGGIGVGALGEYLKGLGSALSK